MTPDDMARELRAAGWTEWGGGWSEPLPNDFPLPGFWDLEHAHAWMKELAQQRAQGTVQTPVVGTEET